MKQAWRLGAKQCLAEPSSSGTLEHVPGHFLDQEKQYFYMIQFNSI